MPRVRRVLETALYFDDLDSAVDFYVCVMGLRVLTRVARLVALDAGEGSVLLLFLRGATASGVSSEVGWLPAHDGAGPYHFALAIDADELAEWRDRLAEEGIDIESEVTWAAEGTSLYFRDPGGHSVELATPGVWPTY